MARFQIEYYVKDAGTLNVPSGPMGETAEYEIPFYTGTRGQGPFSLPTFSFGSPSINTVSQTVEANTQEEAEAKILARNPNIVVTRLSTALPEEGDPEFIGPSPLEPLELTGSNIPSGATVDMAGASSNADMNVSNENILPAQVDLSNLTQYLSQLGTTADALYNEVINNRDSFVVKDPTTGLQVFDPIAQLVLERAAISRQQDLELAQQNFQEEQNRLQRDLELEIVNIQNDTTIDLATKQNRIDSMQLAMERELGKKEIAATERIAIARADAEKAQADRLYAQNQQQFQIEQDRINANLGLQLAELEKRRVLDEKLADVETQRQKDIANIQAQVGLGANVTQERVAEANRLAAERSADQARIADIEVGRRQAVAQEQVAETQADAQIEIANANRAAQAAIAQAQADQTTTLADKEIAIQKIFQTRDEEIARLNREADKTIATTQAQTSPFFGLDTPAERAQAQLAGTGGAFGALGTLAASGTPFTAEDILQAQRGGLSATEQLALARAPGNPFALDAQQQIALQTSLARGGLTPDEQIALARATANPFGFTSGEQIGLQESLARGGITADEQLNLVRAQANPFGFSQEQQIALQTALARGGLTPQEQFDLQTTLARGGLSAENQFTLQTALARGGLTPEQRLAEQRAAIASDIFRASPQTLGALSGVLGGNQNLRSALNPFLGTTFTGNGGTTTSTASTAVPTLGQYQSQSPFQQGATQANFAASGQNLEESILGATPFGVNIPTGTLSAQNI